MEFQSVSGVSEPVSHKADEVDRKSESHEGIAEKGEEYAIIACLSVVVYDGSWFRLISNNV